MAPGISAAMVAYGRSLAEPRLSPDGGRLAFVSTSGGRTQLVVVPATGGPELVVTADPPPRGTASYGGGVFDWTPDGAELVYAAADGGLWVVPAAGGVSRRLVAGTRGSAASAPAVSPEGDRVAYVADQRHVAVIDLAGRGWPARVSGSADFAFDPAWSSDSLRLAWHEWDVPAMPWDAGRIMVAAAPPDSPRGDPRPVAGGDDVSVQQPRWAPGSDRLGYLSDATGWLNVWVHDEDRPLLDEHHEHGDPAWGLGQRSWVWSPDGRHIAVCRNLDGFGSLAVVDLTTGEQWELGRGVHGGLSWVGDHLAAIRSGARTPTEVVVYSAVLDAEPSRLRVARGPVGGFESTDLVEPDLVTWSSGGTTVHGRLYRPTPAAAADGRPPAMLVWVHGGPTGQWTVSWLPRVAYFVERGWAVLVPDHRGSTGHGRAYTQAMRGGWGDVDVADVAAGMVAAAEHGWGDPRAMVPIGGSSGGFTVLNLLARHPELCAAGIDLYGVTDLFELDETTHRFEAHYNHSIVGPLPAAAEAYRDRSPINHVERIRAPLLVLYGDNDPVVPPAQSRQLVERLRRLDRTVEAHEYPGEGHGWSRPETITDELERIESFLRRHVLRWRR